MSAKSSSNLPDAISGAHRFQMLVEAVKDYAIYLLDRDGHVISWNAGAHRFKGYTAEEIIGQHFSRFYTEEDRAGGLPERALRTAAEEGKFEGEGWRVRKDGTRFWTSVVIDPVLDSSGEVIGFAKVTRDITEKKENQRALFESEQRFRMLVQGVHDYAIYMLDEHGLVTEWNSGAEAIKGYKAEEIIGQHFSRFYTEEDRAKGEPERALATALREGKYETEALRVHKNGSTFWANVVLDPIRDDTGKLIGFAKITRDITERRRAQEEVERAREALSQAQKMEAVGRLTGGVAHDFNNLLTIIRSSIDLLKRPGLSEERRERYLDAIGETTSRAALLTGQLLAFARRQPLRPEIFNVAARVRGLEQIITTSLGSPIRLSIELPDRIASVEADPNQFETALLNIVINARDAMPEGGQLTISAAETDCLPQRLATESSADTGYVTVTIRDTGIGMDDETMAQIFEPFFTTKEVNKGTGLGLSQVYGFTKQSGGEIEVSSTPGEGTAFTLYLPQVAREPAEAEVPSRDARTTQGLQSARVLVVEDNEKVGEFTAGLLEELGQEVHWVRDAASALELLERSQDFDIVFSDIVMPGMNGVEMAQEIRRRWPRMPVVLTSGYSHILAQEGHHGFDLLQKPYSVDTLMAALARHGAEPGNAS